MKARSMTAVLLVLCIFLGWRLAARPRLEQQAQQESLAINTRPLVIDDTDIELLRQDLRAQRQRIIAQNLPMTESEAIKFWAVYKRYTADLREINDEKYRLVKTYGDEWASMTDDEALIYIRRWLEVDDQAHQLRSKYVMDVSQALPGKKAAAFFQLDRRISLMMDLQLASQLPLATQQEKPR